MYKVYFENRFIVLSSQPDRLQKYCLFYKFNDVRELYEQISAFIEAGDIPCANFYTYKIDYLWNAFTSYFNYLEAAGGVVLHSSGKLLFIKRYGRWDIPKGHIDYPEGPGECALREISEECGIDPGKELSPLNPTYHIYRYNNKLHLKKTHWYLVRYDGPFETTPQGSEGITEAVWIPADKAREQVTDTWASVSDVLKEVFLKLSHD